MRQIISNLLDNAIKFTECGQVSLDAHIEEVDGGKRLVVEVADTGIGISAERIDGLLLPFQQDGAEELSNQGMRVGLAVSEALALRMGGEIEVESRLGEGSRFTLFVPLRLLGLPSAPIVLPTEVAEGLPEAAVEHPLTPEQRERLLHWARRGEITAIRRYFQTEEALSDPNPRLARVRELALHLDMKGIKRMLEDEDGEPRGEGDAEK